MKRAVFCHALALVATTALGQMPGMGRPPAEAFSTCEGRPEGSACQFDAPHGQVQGECRTMREARPVCVPAAGRSSDGQRNRSPGQTQGTASPGSSRGDRPTPFGAAIAGSNAKAVRVESRIPDTSQGSCFDSSQTIPCPPAGSPFHGQDGHYEGAVSAYRDNGDGTINDLVTGLTWQKGHHDTRLDYYGAEAACHALTLGGKRDWRLPTIKELFSLADFRGSQGRRAYIDNLFEFRQPGTDVLEGDRFAATHTTGMMGQTWSSTRYAGVHFGRPGVEAAFFFNFLDGHIKQAPTRGRNRLFYRCVRGPAWGENHFIDLGRGQVKDRTSGLVWQKADDGRTRDWSEALNYCQSLELDGQRGWRLPNVKELQSIVDYTRHAPALDERFLTMTDPKGWFWSSTTHGDNIRHAAYVCFGPCTSIDGVDVHGAGAQRSDPKAGDPSSFGALGGQRDEVRIRNYVRCVR